MKERRHYTGKELRQFRFDKRRPKRLKIKVYADLGDKEQITTYSLPAIAEERLREIPKQKTGEWTILYRGNGLKILHTTRTDRVYMFTESGDYIGELDDIDMMKIAMRLLENLNAFRQEVHWRHRNKVYYKTVLNLRKIPLAPNWGPKHG